MVDENKGKIENGRTLDDIYFFKIGKIRYLKSNKYKKGCCQVCGKKRKTTAHHLIPKRLKCICPHLAEVRVRVCSECDEQFHPENKFIKESDVVSRQSKKINSLQESIRSKSNEIIKLTKGIKGIGDEAIILSESKEVNKDGK